ncbi:MAG: S41 family peptidase [Blautia sp.]|nr:S41 family peptidase [Blautia sp.]
MEERNNQFWKGVLAGALGVVLILTLLIRSDVSPVFIGRGILGKAETVEKLETLEHAIDTWYLEPVDKEKMADWLYYGMVAGLEDPYSRYYNAEEYAKENEINDGAYVGIGVEIRQTDDGVEVAKCYEGAPADLAGVRAGDLLLAIDGEDVTDRTSAEVASLIRQQGKEEVILTLRREGEKEPLEIPVAVTSITIPDVSGRMLQDQIGYMAISGFTNGTPDQFIETYARLEEEGMDKLIVDLRDNPGGLLESVCKILEEILPEGLIVYTEDKYGTRKEWTCSGEHPLDIPLVVLVNQDTASAAEIFTGAVKDYGIGTVVGTTTFGKGIVQSLMGLGDGSALQLTTAYYYTPNGVNIHKKGIEPDVTVEADEGLTGDSEYTDEQDNQLQEAIRILQNKEVI